MIKKIAVKGLYGTRVIEADISDNTLIIVGENGSGKTTFLRIIFYFLSGRWMLLSQFKFDSIQITFDDSVCSLESSVLAKLREKIEKRRLADMPSSIRHKILELMESGRSDLVSEEIERLSRRLGFSMDYMYGQLDLLDENAQGRQKELNELRQKIRKSINSQILYLPTYRRIERELGSIVEGLDSENVVKHVIRDRTKNELGGSSYVELVEFGMRDVQDAISKTLLRLKDFARENATSLTQRYLGDVVTKSYVNVNVNDISKIEESTVKSVLDRIDESLLSNEHKHQVSELIKSTQNASVHSEHEKIIYHYFLKLLEFQQSLNEKEQAISKFCSLCSEYIVDKMFVYDSSLFSFKIIPKDEKYCDRDIQLSDLSSGEKQIVSLFSHLYLSGINRWFVLIDEPELSLSVPWQRRFLVDIKKGAFCSGIIAVTHSPFIYDNELKKYARSMGEFSNINE